MTTKVGTKQDEAQPAADKAAKTSAEETAGSDVETLMGEIEGEVEEKDREKPETGDLKPESEEEDQEEGETEAGEEDEAKSEDEDDDEDDSGKAEEKPDEDLIKKGEIKGLPEDVQERINRKIGKSVARRKQAEEARAAAEERATAAEAKVAEFEGRFSDETAKNITRLGLPAELLTQEDAKLLSQVETLRESRAFCMAHTAGYEASGEGDDTKSYTAQQIGARLAQVLDQLDELGPKAARIREERTATFRQIMKLGQEALKNQKSEVKGQKSETAKTETKKVLKAPPIPAAATPRKTPAGKAKVGLTADEVTKAPNTKGGMLDLLERAM